LEVQYCIITVDWSGAADTPTQRRKIWRCTAVGTSHSLYVEALENGLTREETIARVIQKAQERQPLLVGLDFAFSFPHGYVARQLGKDRETWNDIVAWCAREGERVLRECPPPFWGRAGSRRPAPRDLPRFGLRALLRETERCIGTAKPVFQIAGPGAVGTGALRGIPWLAVLREAGFAIWPFDRPTEGRPIVVEIYPRLFTPRVRKSHAQERTAYLRRLRAEQRIHLPTDLLERAAATDDGFDALAAVAGVWRTLRRGGFPRFPDSFYDDPIVQIEGWMWGVPPR